MKLIAAAAIVGAAILGATGLTIYFSPFQTCMRSAEAMPHPNKEAWCAQLTGK